MKRIRTIIYLLLLLPVTALHSRAAGDAPPRAAVPDSKMQPAI